MYISRRLSLGTATVAGGFAAAGIVALDVIAPLRVLAKRFASPRFLSIAQFTRAVISPLYPLTNRAVAFRVVITLLTVADRLASPVFQATVGTIVATERRTETMGYIRALRNAGFSLGALLTSDCRSTTW